jgi:ferredoxin
MNPRNYVEPAAGRRRKSLRDIVEIDEDLCDGCGLCLPSCAEGALMIEGGRVTLKEEACCDGLGACLGSCPKGALTLARRFTDDFSPRPEEDSAEGQGRLPEDVSSPDRGRPLEGPPTPAAGRAPSFGLADAPKAAGGPSGPSQRPRPGGLRDDPDLTDLIKALESNEASRPWPGLDEIRQVSEPVRAPAREDVQDYELLNPEVSVYPGARRSLVSWPVQLALVPPKSPVFNVPTIVVAADCAAFASPDFHRLFLGGRTPLVIGCPKLDDFELYAAKLGVILRDNPKLTEVRLPIMEVACCRGLWRLAREALKRSKRREVRLLGWVFATSGLPLESSVNLSLEYGD